MTSIHCNQQRFYRLYDLQRREDSFLGRKCENKLDVIWSTHNNGQIFVAFRGVWAVEKARRDPNVSSRGGDRLELKVSQLEKVLITSELL